MKYLPYFTCIGGFVMLYAYMNDGIKWMLPAGLAVVSLSFLYIIYKSKKDS
jgi:hypothetical protein